MSTELPPIEPTSEDIHRLEAQRRENREKAAALGLEPYGRRVDGLVTLGEAFESYDAAGDAAQKEHGKEDGFVDPRPVVKIAGRIVLRRPTGRLIWLNLRDHTNESFQVAVSKRDCDEQGFALVGEADLGDIVVAEGPLVMTRTGEITCWATSVRPAAKCLVPPPEKHAGLSDHETRYRMRYVDMWANPGTTKVFALRSRIVSAIRAFLGERGYLEVETPMLQTQAGGAAARPFVTHMNALDIDLYLRIAPELYLKRLLVGGLPKVFEINRNFRNEGLDKQHNPEFTMLELYHAFGDCETVMEMTESLIRHAAAMVGGADGPVLPFGELSIDYGRPFERIAYGALFESAFGFAMGDHDRVRREAESRGVKLVDEKGEAIDLVFVVNELFEAVAEPMLDPALPTFVTRYPAALSPLTRAVPGEPETADRADLFIGGMEIGPHYTELNDPDIQAERFRSQLAGIDDEESTFRDFDADFVNALKVGMPPAGGVGIGIDRLVMLLANQASIRDVVLFPLMRPIVE